MLFMGKIVLKNIISNGNISDIVIEGNMISGIYNAGESVIPENAEGIDCTGKAALPGFVNMHNHAGMAMMRGMVEDISFHKWIDRIWEVEKNIDEEYVYHATRLACLEMVKTGTTTFNDQYWYMTSAYRAAQEFGLRVALSYVVCDRNDPEESERQKVQCQQMYELAAKWPDTVQFMISVHAIYSVREPMILWAVDFARQYLDGLGVLGPDVIAAHTLWLSDKDVEILGKRGVTCVHNINSNLKLASGYKFRYNELRDAGATVCIGTDGCASSNNLDVLEALKTAAMVQKAWRNDPTAMPLDELMQIGSLNGGKALGLNIGVIEKGALADIIIVDTESYHFLSPGSFEANFVYSAHSDSVDSVICNGRFIMRNRNVPDEKDILSKAREYMNKIM